MDKAVRLKKVIGRREHVSFPDLNLKNIEGKVDTGAYSSALHCDKIYIEERNGTRTLCFVALDPSHPAYTGEVCCRDEYTEKEIKNSFGESEKRFIIKIRIKIGNRIFKTPISLTDRGNMRYAVLLGRKILKNRFIVDVSGILLFESRKIKKSKSKK